MVDSPRRRPAAATAELPAQPVRAVRQVLRRAHADHVSPRRVAAMQEALAEAVAMERRIATGLRPLMLDDLGLKPCA